MILLSFIYIDVAIPRYRFRVIVNSLFLFHYYNDCYITRVFFSRIIISRVITLRITSHITLSPFIIITLVISKN